MEGNLRDKCKDNALHLLNELGEFYPFAYGYSKTKGLISVNTYFGDEFPLSEDVIKELVRALHRSSMDHNFEAVCICVDVIYTDHEDGMRTDALQMRINIRGQEPVEYVIPYFKISEGKFKIGDQIEKFPGDQFFQF